MKGPSGKKSSSAGQERRPQILTEAAKLVAERGFYGFGLQELAQRCGLTKAGILHHFGSKNQILIDLLKDRDISNSPAVSRLLGTENDSQKLDLYNRDDVLRVFSTIVENNSHQPELVRLYAVLRLEALNSQHPAHNFFLRREAIALERFSRILEHHDRSRPKLARAFMALMTGMEAQWLQEEFGFDLVAEWEDAAARLLP